MSTVLGTLRDKFLIIKAIGTIHTTMAFSPSEKSLDATIEMTEMTQQSTPSSSDATVPSRSPTSSSENGDKALEALGYTPVGFSTREARPFGRLATSADIPQVFKREFTRWSSFSFAMSISGVYGTLMSTWIYGLQAGGAAAIMWSWIIGGAGAWALAYSIAEIASAYPSSGAMYFTLKFLAPENQVPFLCWIAGKFLDTPVPGTLLTGITKATSISWVP